MKDEAKLALRAIDDRLHEAFIFSEAFSDIADNAKETRRAELLALAEKYNAKFTEQAAAIAAMLEEAIEILKQK